MSRDELLSEEEVLELIKEEFGSTQETNFDFSIPNATNGIAGC